MKFKVHIGTMHKLLFILSYVTTAVQNVKKYASKYTRKIHNILREMPLNVPDTCHNNHKQHIKTTKSRKCYGQFLF